MVRDTLERANDPALDLKTYLLDAYVHPVFKDENNKQDATRDEEEGNLVVRTRRKAQKTAHGPTRVVYEFGSTANLLIKAPIQSFIDDLI